MWPFTVKKKKERSRIDTEGYALSELIERPDMRDLHGSNAQLRVWIPEPCKQALDETLKLSQTTGSRYIRELFVVYLYGEHELLRMRSAKTGIYYVPPPPDPLPAPSNTGPRDIMFSRAAESEMIPGLGKNICPIKIFLHEKIKNDLQALADSTNMPLSQFVREILVSHFLGHTLWPERIRSWTPSQEEVGRLWEEGELEAETVCSVFDKSSDEEFQHNLIDEYRW